ncbi:hypothetical protein CCR75_008487 [Bremia lactucae]|uniref:Cyclin N-terminal domain-containing protein n=1 Tax=Bremia lactucae TaxID=4779 RepID=A0A976IFF6_BRELC|nr:hypothetical protein CCR75_008487 [Bremia lactucae]
MADTGLGSSAFLESEERVSDNPTTIELLPVDEERYESLTAPPEVFSTMESALNLECDGGDSSVPPRLPRSQKPRKRSKTPRSKSNDLTRHKKGTTRGSSDATTLFQTPDVTAMFMAPLQPERPLLSESPWEVEIAGFGTVLNNVLHCVTNRELVAKTAEYMAAYPHHALRFQIKMKQPLATSKLPFVPKAVEATRFLFIRSRANADGVRGFQSKLMLFYVLHEFLKSFEGDRLQHVQREWFQTIDEVLHACAREIRYGEKRNKEENRKRVFKTLARWEELKLFPNKIKTWKLLVLGEGKPRRAPIPLPRSESERQTEAPDQLQSFDLPPPSLSHLHLDRSNCPLVFERTDFQLKVDEKQHWRYTAIAFINLLTQCLGLNSDIALTACVYFHRVFDRGIYAQERYKFAAACVFLSAKASSKRMKLFRMVRTMYDILEKPLLAGDEELLEIERLQLLYYEMEVLQGIDFELTIDMPFYYLRRVLNNMPEKFRDSISEETQSVLEELFYLPVCVHNPPQVLGEAAAFIASWNQGKDFKFQWCSSSQRGGVLNERTAKDALQRYQVLQKWKKRQQLEFETFVKSASALEGDETDRLKLVFKSQLGGLRLDPSMIRNEAEFTKKTDDESKEWVQSRIKNEQSRHDTRLKYSSTRYRDDKETRIKVENRAESRNLSRYGLSHERERTRCRQRSQSRSISKTRYDKRSGSSMKYVSRYDYDDYDDDDRHRDYRREEDKYYARDRGSAVYRDIEYYDSSYLNHRRRKSDRNGGLSGAHERDSSSHSRSRSWSRSPRDYSRRRSKRRRIYSSYGRSDSRSRSFSRSYSRDRSSYNRVEKTSVLSTFEGNRKNKISATRSTYRHSERSHIKQERSAA